MAVGLDEQIGDLSGVVLQQQEVQRSEDGFSLLPYQRSAVEYALQRSGRVLLGHEMGLGKTGRLCKLQEGLACFGRGTHGAARPVE